jgi:predicted HD phosphohydrolase
MRTVTSVDDIVELFALKGSETYGEDVTALQHAVQCAMFAERDGADRALIVATLLHDLGHLVADVQGTERFDLETDDDDHEAIGGRLLAPLFGPDVAQPVALHVTAKRWRCRVEPDYHDALSDVSRATLKAQGGPLDDEGCRRFEAHPGFTRARALRNWDEEGKIPNFDGVGLEHFIPMMREQAAEFAALKTTN